MFKFSAVLTSDAYIWVNISDSKRGVCNQIILRKQPVNWVGELLCSQEFARKLLFEWPEMAFDGRSGVIEYEESFGF